MIRIFTTQTDPGTFLGLVQTPAVHRRPLRPAPKTPRYGPRRDSPVNHALVNTALAALLLLIGIMGLLTLNAARQDTSRAGLTPQQANDRVVFCHLDSCDLA
ncbi:hypothetical protein [Luteithermobacter gelatinilyticus]|uniref:hypothetical protein n=1 Tax=Luteithermobacter gelatinilyticus TaxID=2582913 RepID=UPI00110626BD|nr:hypothetical protein [Luteithermobacter gelatinilyticus]